MAGKSLRKDQRAGTLQHGFTTLELVVVVACVGILLVALLVFSG